VSLYVRVDFVVLLKEKKE